MRSTVVLSALAAAAWAGPADAGPIRVLADRAYRADPDADRKHKLDLYLPAGKKNFPTMFFVHGGSWRSGDRRDYRKMGKMFAEQGVGCAVVSYRLSPQVRHPAHIEDVAAAFAWVKKNIARHGGAAGKIFAVGHSAGGHLVALLATDGQYLQEHGLKPAAIAGVVPISGVHLPVPVLFNKVFGKDYKLRKLAFPITHVKGGHPPFLLVYADRDLPTLETMAKKMNQALEAADSPTRLLRMEGRNHLDIIVKMFRPTDKLTRAILAFMRPAGGS